jgi:hypothetical protein
VIGTEHSGLAIHGRQFVIFRLRLRQQGIRWWRTRGRDINDPQRDLHHNHVRRQLRLAKPS